MKEQASRPVPEPRPIRPAPRPPEIVRPPAPVAPAAPEAPDYTQATNGGLRRAEAVQMTRLTSADLGHFMLQTWTLAQLLYAFLRGEDIDIDWDPPVRGMNPALDEKQQHAEEHLQAIWREQSRRRVVRHQLRNR